MSPSELVDAVIRPAMLKKEVAAGMHGHPRRMLCFDGSSQKEHVFFVL